jgi:hypothetical protein
MIRQSRDRTGKSLANKSVRKFLALPKAEQLRILGEP